MAAHFDVEDETILTGIFKDSFPDSWRDNTDFTQYLAELSSYGIDRLAREPDRLAEEKSQILEETQDLAFHNYKTFIQTAECSQEIYQDFQIIERNVEDMLAKLPQFTDQCQVFTKKAQEISTDRRMNSLTLQRHTQLLEILEMPQLMDTCVRNGYYEEALELASHVKKLEKKHSAIPIIGNIVNEVKNSCQLMLNQLISQLRSNIQLPACLKVIGYLRRMDIFSEVELRIKFLQARDSWFQSILDNLPRQDQYNHITKTIESSRVHLFDIITQYRAIFSDDDSLVPSTKDVDSLNDAALFHGWVVEKVSQFLSTLKHDLEQGVGSRLDSLLGQCMYFGLSFSRVGADFRSLLIPIFQEAAFRTLDIAVVDATKRFEEMMQTYTLLTTTASMYSSSSSTYSITGQTNQLQPPMNLVEYHPLAVYCNNVLTAFNDLRLCAPIALVDDVCKALQASLIKVVKVILSFHRTEEGAFNVQERDNFIKFCQAFAEDLVPYLNKCLQSLFPPGQIAQILGVSVIELYRMGNIGLIDTKEVLDDLEHILPSQVEEEEIIETTKTENKNENDDNTHPESPIKDAVNSNSGEKYTTEQTDLKESEVGLNDTTQQAINMTVRQAEAIQNVPVTDVEAADEILEPKITSDPEGNVELENKNLEQSKGDIAIALKQPVDQTELNTSSLKEALDSVIVDSDKSVSFTLHDDDDDQDMLEK